MIEIELKFKIPADAQRQFQETLEALPSVQKIGHIVNADTYYDTTSLACFQQTVFMRIRNHTHLEVKYHEQPDPAHISCIERAFPLQSEAPQLKEMHALCARFIPGWQETDTIEEALRLNALIAFAHVVNRRTQYTYDNLTLCIDHVEGLGDFFEIETLCKEETEIRQAQTQQQNFVSDLAFPGLQLSRSGYVEQWLHLHLPQVYQ